MLTPAQKKMRADHPKWDAGRWWDEAMRYPGRAIQVEYLAIATEVKLESQGLESDSTYRGQADGSTRIHY